MKNNNTKTPNFLDAVLRGTTLVFCSLLLSACATRAMNPDTAEVFALLEQADAAYARGEWISAAQAYEELTRRVPQDAYAWLRLGNVHLQQGRVTAAIRAYEASLAREPEQGKVYYNLATAYLLKAQSSLEGAEQRILPHDPGKHLVNERLETLANLLRGELSESQSPGAGLRHQRDVNAPAPRVQYYLPDEGLETQGRYKGLETGAFASSQSLR